jgi:hypothetical protein
MSQPPSGEREWINTFNNHLKMRSSKGIEKPDEIGYVISNTAQFGIPK